MNSSLTTALRDPRRLAALGATELMDSAAEPSFDRLTEHAARLLGAPTAVMSLIDDRRQFFKSLVGLGGEAAEQRGTPLSHSFCQHVVHTGMPLRVQDARRHPLVRDNPAVRDLEVVGYLGVPLVAPGGAVIGSLCATDSKPHVWTDADTERLATLAAEVTAELERRERERVRALDEAGPAPGGGELDLRALVDEACESVAGDALLKGLELTAWIDDAVPATLRCDAERLRQALEHLLANAIVFTPAGRVDVRVRAQAGAVLRVEVADTGIGIAAEDLEGVFEPFAQTSAGARLRPGAAGLGLPAARRLAQLLGGDLGVRSRPGEGSTFHFTARFRP
jgi:signal transduction histidine kinase